MAQHPLTPGDAWYIKHGEKNPAMDSLGKL
jgi:hypothetical protein